MYTRTCPECGTVHQTPKRHGDFCSTAHRKAYNNRRMLRGAILYDAFMTMRFDRDFAKQEGLWQLICRQAGEWKDEDDRAGRKPFKLPREWIVQNKVALTCDKWQKSGKKGN